MLHRDGTGMDGHCARVECNLSCYSDCSLLPFYTLLAPAPVGSAAMVPVGCVPSMPRLAPPCLYLFCMVIRSTDMKYGTGYWRYQVRTFSIYRYASGVRFRILRYGFQYFGVVGTPGANSVHNNYVHDRGDGKYHGCATAVQMWGGFGA